MNSIGNSLNHYPWAPQNNLKGRKAKAQLANDPKLEEVKRKSAPAIKNTDGVQRPEVDNGKKGRGLIEVSLRDPWPPDDPLRNECDQFLKIFAETYHEVLAEMEMTPKSGDYTAIVMSKKDLDEISKRIVEKLKANPVARELMAALNVNVSDGHHKRTETEADTLGEGASRTFGMERQKHQEAAQAAENDARQDISPKLSAWANSELGKNAWLFKLQPTISNSEAAGKTDHAKPSAQTKPAGGQVSPKTKAFPGDIYKKFTSSLNDDGSLNKNDPNTARFFASLGFPEMVANVILAGDNSLDNAEARGRLGHITFGYFDEVKAMFGCDDETYLPYVPGLPEYNPATAAQMRHALFEKIEADPEALSLINAVGGTWPIPEENWNKFSLTDLQEWATTLEKPV